MFIRDYWHTDQMSRLSQVKHCWSLVSVGMGDCISMLISVDNPLDETLIQGPLRYS